MRNSIEPLGDDLRVLCRHYEEFSGEKIDHKVVDFHTLLFAVLGSMQFTGTVGVPQPGDAHSVYMEFDLALRQVILLSQASLMGETITPEPAPTPRIGDNAATLAKLADTVARIDTTVPLEVSRRDSAAQIIEWLVRSDAMGEEMKQRDLADVSALLGQPFTEWPVAEAALEAYVLRARPEDDAKLFKLFAAIEGRKLLLYGPTRIGHSATHVVLTPTH
jgi:hypothetical protein